MISDQELTLLEQRYPTGGSDLYEDAYRLIQVVKIYRQTLSAISAQDMLLRPDSELKAVHDRLMVAVHLSRSALGLPKTGEHTTLAGTSGPAANNSAQIPATQPQPARPAPNASANGPIPGQAR